MAMKGNATARVISRGYPNHGTRPSTPSARIAFMLPAETTNRTDGRSSSGELAGRGGGGRAPAGSHQQHFRQISREQKAEELLDVLVDAAAFLDRADDGGEVVIEQDQVRHLTADIRATLAHPHPDIRAL